MLSHVCRMCNAVYSDSSNLRRHIRICHTKERYYKCEECTMVFTRSDHLSRHLDRHFKRSERQECGVNGCRRYFIDNEKLEEHRAMHRRKLEEDVKLIKGYPVRKVVVNDGFHLICPFEGCGRVYASYPGMNKHINFHMDPEKKPALIAKDYDCDICGAVLENKKLLVKHMKKLHIEPSVKAGEEFITERTFYVCPHEGCRKIYTTLSNMCMHKARVHDNVVFKCDDCNLQFKWNRSLQNHKCRAKLQS